MPTRELAIYDGSFTSSADLTTKQYFAVKLHTVADQIALAGAGDGVAILQNKPNTNQAGQVRHLGISRHVVDGSVTAIAIGDRLKSDAAGKGVKAATANDLTYATALEAATGSADEIAVLMTGPLRIHV